MKKSLLIVVALLVAASLMAAMAYNQATVTSGDALRIVNTSAALLAIKPGTGLGNLDATAYTQANGTLKIDFGKSGLVNDMVGLQSDSTYVWDNLISLKNNSKENVDITITLEGAIANFITMSSTDATFAKTGTYTYKLSLPSGAEVPLGFKADLNGANVQNWSCNGIIRVDAIAK